MNAPPFEPAPAVTLDTCAEEPIHIPGAVQAHGTLFACRGSDLVVAQVSDNVQAHVGVAPEDVLGRPLADMLDDGSRRALAAASTHASLREVNPVAIAARDGRAFDAVLHRIPGDETLIVEIEPHDSGASRIAPSFDPRLRAAVLRLQQARSVRALCEIAAAEVRGITGFDRAMVYRFDDDWNGEVVAESKADGLEPFLGLHYPASDIPEQARRLYTVNWLRFIPDVGYAPSPLVPRDDPARDRPLDLSHAVLRSVSPIHLEYLRNMRVTASMSISILLDGRLAGLIACHHYAGPRRIPFRIRDTAEFLGQALSWQLGVLEAADAVEEARRTQENEAALIRSVVTHAELLDGLAGPELLAMTAADGAAVVLQEGMRRVGEAPPAHAIAPLVRWLRETHGEVFATDRIAAEWPEAEAWSETAAGLVAVAISRDLGEYLIWFRRPSERTVDWAGDPRKQGGAEASGAPRLSPRGSFELWREVVRGRALPWAPVHVDAASSLRKVLLGGVRKRAVELREMNRRLSDADRTKDSFIAAVSHELRTPLNAITGWTHLLQSGVLPKEQWSQAVEVIARNARTQAQIVDDLLDISRITSGKLTLDIQAIDLVRIVEEVLESSALSLEAKGLRLRRALDPRASLVLGDATRLRQIVFNLVTNAVKFTPKGGSVTVVLQRQRSDVELIVSDSGQGIAPDFLPYVFEPFRQASEGLAKGAGLGLGLAIVKKLVEMHGGRVVAESEGEDRGATFRVRLPIAPVVASPGEPEHEAGTRPLDCPPELDGLDILVVEDEADASEMLRIVLARCGARVVVAERASVALERLAAQRFDLVISDIGLPEMDGLDFIRELRRREAKGPRTPAVALTAYTRGVDRTRALQAGFSAHVPKPIDASELVTVAASVVGRLP